MANQEPGGDYQKDKDYPEPFSGRSAFLIIVALLLGSLAMVMMCAGSATTQFDPRGWFILGLGILLGLVAVWLLIRAFRMRTHQRSRNEPKE